MNAPGSIAFVKMNGLGNEIVVVDLRGSTKIFTAKEAAAIAARQRSHFDQMMVLHDPKTRGTEAFVRIYNTDGSLSCACGNGTRWHPDPLRVVALHVGGSSVNAACAATGFSIRNLCAKPM